MRRPAVERNIENVLTSADLVRSFARAAKGKAGGVDGILDDFVRAAPVEASKLVHPLITKQNLRIQEPLLQRGGVAHKLHKRREVDLITNYTSVLLKSVIA